MHRRPSGRPKRGLPGMDVSMDLRVTELLCSRLCHDLVSPVGAINNGIELIEDLGADVMDEAIGLIGASGEKMAHHLRFFRMAYGLAGTDSLLSFQEIRELIAGYLADGKVTLDWPDHAVPLETASCGVGKLLLNLTALAVEGLPRGGDLVIKVGDDSRLEVTGKGIGAGLSDELRATLDSDFPVERLEPRTVHGYFTACLVERQGATLNFAPPAEDLFTILTGPFSGPSA